MLADFVLDLLIFGRLPFFLLRDFDDVKPVLCSHDLAHLTGNQIEGSLSEVLIDDVLPRECPDVATLTGAWTFGVFSSCIGK